MSDLAGLVDLLTEALEPFEIEGQRPIERFYSRHHARDTVTYLRHGDVFVREMQW